MISQQKKAFLYVFFLVSDIEKKFLINFLYVWVRWVSGKSKKEAIKNIADSAKFNKNTSEFQSDPSHILKQCLLREITKAFFSMNQVDNFSS